MARWNQRGIIGDPDVDQRIAWVWVADGPILAKFHADTTREAVREYLSLASQHAGRLRWTVGLSSRGRASKIAIGPEARVIDGLYLYLADSLVGKLPLGQSGYD
ncbi:MAG TPA: hypothetical protein VGB92_09835 [Longimicrobium sp.]|jgi:hypothetical protein